MTTPALVTAATLARKLQRPAPTANSAEAGAWDEALLDASNDLRGVIGQPISATTSTVDLAIDGNGWVKLPFCPVRAVTAVVIDTVHQLTSGRWQLDCDRMHLWVGWPCSRATVTVDHGWTETPGEIAKWVCVLAAAQLAAVSTGSLGAGGAESITVDGDTVRYGSAATATSGAALIPDTVADRLRSQYGGGW